MSVKSGSGPEWRPPAWGEGGRGLRRRGGGGMVRGKLVTVLGVVLVGVTAPVVLITWLIVPTLPRETVSRSCQAIPELVATGRPWPS